MRRRLHAVVLGVVLAALATNARAADMTWTFSVQLSAAVNADPARIELKWTTDQFPVKGYTVARKAVNEAAWGEGIELPSTATNFIDEGVELGKTYEYQVIRHAVAYTAYGYVAAGINAPLVESRGRAVLVVDQSIAEPLAGELARFQSDLAGDGWTVVRKDVARDAAPAEVKAAIRAEWDADRAGTQAVILFGHVPVVKSGNLNVDGHASRPMPADVFYAEMDGDWTDANGDGIYDQNTLPSDAELMIGRIDFADLPGKYSPVAYPGEVELLRRYLDKDHAFRHAAVRPASRALVGNAIGDANGQAYAASGYRNFAALVGADNVTTASADLGAAEDRKWISRLAADDYLWAYGCGAGSDFTVGGLGFHGQYRDFWASDFLEKKAKGTFYLMFGSWFSEWNKSDNVLRTALAAPDHGLAAAWSGRPHLFFHHMGIGAPIGYGIRASQNNEGLYRNQVQRQLRGIHVALMGDPTLRMHQVAPPSEVTAREDGNGVAITWKRSPDDVLGYHVYRAANATGPFVRVSENLLAPDSGRFVDANRNSDARIYQVRAVTLKAGPSGSYYTSSQGISASW